MPQQVIITRDFDHMSEVAAEFIRTRIARILASAQPLLALAPAGALEGLPCLPPESWAPDSEAPLPPGPEPDGRRAHRPDGCPPNRHNNPADTTQRP